MTKKILLCGNYGAGNLGDEAILAGFLRQLEGDITVMSANPAATTKEFGVPSVGRVPSGFRSNLKALLSPGQLRETKKAISDCDCFVLGGGTLLTDEPPASMFVWGAQLKAVFKQNKPIEIRAGGVGPFHSDWARKRATSILENATTITVRDQKSKETVKKLINKEVSVVSDLVLANPPTIPQVIPQKDLVILSPRYWQKGHENTQKALQEFVHYLCASQKKYIIGIPFEKNNERDLKMLAEIFNQPGVKDQSEIWNNYQNEDEVLQKIAEAELLVGMRLHSLIFAHLTSTPLIGISYMEKVAGVLGALTTKEHLLELSGLTSEYLKKAYLSACPKASS
jgi:polysaccharide pyruvyl transferase CsaB